MLDQRRTDRVSVHYPHPLPFVARGFPGCPQTASPCYSLAALGRSWWWHDGKLLLRRVRLENAYSLTRYGYDPCTRKNRDQRSVNSKDSGNERMDTTDRIIFLANAVYLYMHVYMYNTGLRSRPIKQTIKGEKIHMRSQFSFNRSSFLKVLHVGCVAKIKTVFGVWR